MKLSDAKCRTASTKGEKPQKFSDGGGLYLYVSPSGSKIWRMDYKFADKWRTSTFGPYPETTLQQARFAREKVKDKLSRGLDPSLKTGGDLFSDAAKDWFAAKCSGLADSYSGRIWSRIEQDIIPAFGDKPLGTIDPQEVLRAVREIEARGAIETAKRVLGYVNNIFAFAAVEGKYKGANPATGLLLGLKRNPPPKRRKALRLADVGAFFEKLDQQPLDVTRLALEVVVRTFVRTGEMRFATWDEIGDDGLWRIPAARMKMGRDHLVPLTRQVQGLLRQLRDAGGGSKWIMPQPCGTKPQSENAMLYMMYRMGYSGRATVHGFRRLASTTLNESTLFRSDAIEMQLAHAEEDDVRAAYNEAEYLGERIEMMKWYSDLLDSQRKRDVGDLSDLLG